MSNNNEGVKELGNEFSWQKLPSSRLLVEVSLWSADLSCLADEIRRIDPFADMYHIDVSDGHFVPGFLFFADLVAALRPLTTRPFHVHLMTANPLNHVRDFVLAGGNIVTVHAENGPMAPAAMDAIRKEGASTGLALGVDILPETIEPYLDLVDMLLIMGTPMGVKGVKPSQFVYDRIQQIKSMVAKAGLEHQVKVFADGGIRENTVPRLFEAGADGVIAGSLAFKSANLEETFTWLHSFKTKARTLK